MSEEVTGTSQSGKTRKMTLSDKALDIVADIVTYLLSAAILIGAVVFAFNASPTKSIFGYRYYTILTASMAPTYDIGDVIIVKIAGPEDIDVGDVITFNPSRDSDAYLTHRVYEKYDDYEGTGVTCFKTKGDANNAEDSFLIESDRVIGTVKFGIPKLGYVIRFVQLKWYFIAAFVVMLIVFIHLLKQYVNMDNEEDDEDSIGKKAESAQSGGA